MASMVWSISACDILSIWKVLALTRRFASPGRRHQSLVFWANVTPAFLAIGLTLSTLPAPSSG